MPKKAAVRPWTAADLKTLKSLAGREKRAAIARKLKRTPAAVTFKAWQLGISLAVGRTTGRKKAASRKAKR